MLKTAVIRNWIARQARRLGTPRDLAATNALRALRDLASGREPTVGPLQRDTDGTSDEDVQADASEPYGTVPGPPLPPVEPVAEDSSWIDPPVTKKQGVSRSIYNTGKRPLAFNVELLEELNEEYRDKPIVPSPPSWEPSYKAANARRRVEWAHNMIDLRGKVVLEVGCGNGHETWTLAHNLGCDAYGIDVIEVNGWQDLVGDRVHLQVMDLTVANPLEENFFDRVISYTVWEHVAHPYTLLAETFKIMKPGGLQWLRANLFAGPQASHRYRDIFFPWPHLLFSDDVIREWDAKHGRTTQGSAWVNRLTWNHYERYIHDIGFRLRMVRFDVADFDWDFYRRFEDRLGRYPHWDLERDFFLAVLEKPQRPDE